MRTAALLHIRPIHVGTCMPTPCWQHTQTHHPTSCNMHLLCMAMHIAMRPTHRPPRSVPVFFSGSSGADIIGEPMSSGTPLEDVGTSTDASATAADTRSLVPPAAASPASAAEPVPCIDASMMGCTHYVQLRRQICHGADDDRSSSRTVAQRRRASLPPSHICMDHHTPPWNQGSCLQRQCEACRCQEPRVLRMHQVQLRCGTGM